MSRLTEGAMIILFLLVVGALIVFIRTGANAPAFDGACSGGNATACADNGADTGFWDSVSQANPTEIDEDAPPILNTMWLLIAVFLLSTALLLVALAFIPFTSG